LSVLPVGISGEAGAYQIERSLRFNSADSAYLSRTFGSAGNRRTWTWSGWVKRSATGARQFLFSTGTSGSNYGHFMIDSDDKLYYVQEATTLYRIGTTALYRDYGAWYHIVFTMDTTNATSNDRMRYYVNGSRADVGVFNVQPPQNTDMVFNQAAAHSIGRNHYAASDYAGCYLTEIHFIDGSALTPSSFGETDTDTGVWKPKAYSGSYGTNGFYLDFGDNSSTTALGYDAAGSNDWTPNNFSVTAGSGNDSLVDSPTRYGTDTGVGGEVRGNYATLNPLDNGGNSISNGNLYAALSGTSGVYRSTRATFGVSSGKYYWENVANANSGADVMYVGFCTQSASLTVAPAAGTGSGFYAYHPNGSVWANGTQVATYASYTSGDVIGVALDMDLGSATLYKNGSSLGTPFTGLSGTLFPMLSLYAYNSSANLNFGQRPFAYTAPSGFKALCTTNLPEPTIADGEDYFNAVLYTGNTSNQSITGVGFQPDFVWIKSRNNIQNHTLYDAVRGATKYLISNSTTAEITNAETLKSFDSDGFTMGNAFPNESGYTYVAWNWKANGAGSSNTDGTINSTVSANTTAGFSIVTWVGTASGATVGHGLGVAPSMIIIKNRSSSTNWPVWHKSYGGSTNTDYQYLNTTDSKGGPGAANNWNGTAPTPTVISVGDTAGSNGSGANMVAYVFAPIAGYSAFGSYTGNGSTDGPFVHLGFKPKFWMSKRTDSTSNWLILDGTRNTYNIVDDYLVPNSSAAEGSATVMDFVSNGVKFRGTTHNDSGATWIYMAFAENPFSISLAR